MTSTTPSSPRSPRVNPRWTLIQALRQSADRHLAVIAAAAPDSRLLRHCRCVWAEWEREAVISILHDDHANAEVMLDRGVHVLAHTLEVLRKDRLSEEDVLNLIAGA